MGDRDKARTMSVREVQALGPHRYTLVMPATKAERTANPKTARKGGAR